MGKSSSDKKTQVLLNFNFYRSFVNLKYYISQYRKAQTFKEYVCGFNDCDVFLFYRQKKT